MPSKTKLKGGAFTNDERKFIVENMNDMTPEQMGVKLNRNPVLINKFIASHVNLNDGDNKTVRANLRKSVFFKNMQQEFDEDELNYIQEQYVRYMDQVNQNVVATEEVQLLSLIKVEVLMSRNLKNKKRIFENAARYREQVNNMIERVGGQFANLTTEDRKAVMELQNHEASCFQADGSNSEEYIKLQKEHNTLNGKLKTSRDQRVDEIANSKTTFAGYLRDLLKLDKQIEESRQLELNKKAMYKELDRLSQPHEYADKSVDNPILTADIIDKFDKEEKNARQEQPAS
jgi:hypothetical protein